jgi:16S rRNA (cytosine1402-N4)-methyltransferase
MLAESIELLAGGSGRPAPIYADATFGAGGYTEAILQRVPGSRVVALDADPQAVRCAEQLARTYGGRVIAVHCNFADLASALDRAGVSEVDGIVFDLGLSAMQFADVTRGFSFEPDQPLDMRLDPDSGEPTAAAMLNSLTEAQIADLIFAYGGERRSRRIARAIVAERAREPFERTAQLLRAIRRATPAPRAAGRSRIHPATRTFQALRIAVNSELRNLERALLAAGGRVRAGGRVVVVSFHSGEDRVVKRLFRQWQNAGRAVSLLPKPLRPSRAEVRSNRRSRSARLRAVQISGGD